MSLEKLLETFSDIDQNNSGPIFCLLLHALSFQLCHDELKVELDVLFSRLHFVLLAAFDSSFPDLDMKKLIVLPPICSFPGFRLPFGSTAGNVVIDRFLSCKVVE